MNAIQSQFPIATYNHIVAYFNEFFRDGASGITPRIPVERMEDDEATIWAAGERVSRKMTSASEDAQGSSNVEELILARETTTHILYMRVRLCHIPGSISRTGRSRLLRVNDFRYELAKKQQQPILVQPETNVQTN